MRSYKMNSKTRKDKLTVKNNARRIDDAFIRGDIKFRKIKQ
jgi:hypothetical protein